MSNESQGFVRAEPERSESPQPRHELGRLERDWVWLLVLGIALITLGAVAIGSSFFVSVVTVVMFGVLLLMGGVALVISSFWTGKWSAFSLHLLLGLLYSVVGILIVDSPVESAIALTLLIAAFLIVAGAFRIIASLVLRFSNWGWPLLNGFISLLLGILIYQGWPASGFAVIGLFVGIEMILYGWSWVMLGYDVHHVAKREAVAAQPT